MSKRENFLLAAACLSFGMVLGFALSPIKRGVTVSCGNNNTVLPHGMHPREKSARPTPEPLKEEKL